jgi:hypothetical protein
MPTKLTCFLVVVEEEEEGPAFAVRAVKPCWVRQ